MDRQYQSGERQHAANSLVASVGLPIASHFAREDVMSPSAACQIGRVTPPASSKIRTSCPSAAGWKPTNRVACSCAVSALVEKPCQYHFGKRSRSMNHDVALGGGTASSPNFARNDANRDPISAPRSD